MFFSLSGIAYLRGLKGVVEKDEGKAREWIAKSAEVDCEAQYLLGISFIFYLLSFICYLFIFICLILKYFSFYRNAMERWSRRREGRGEST